MTANSVGMNAPVASEFTIAQQLDESRKKLRRSAQRIAAGREPEWADIALQDLSRLRESLVLHREGVRGPDCHYERLCLQAQWLVPRIQKLIARFDQVEFEAGLLGQKLGRVARGEALLVQEARNDTTRLLADLRRTLTEESAVEFDSFNEPPALD